MNSLLNVLNVSFARGSRALFENISFSINTGDRVGFVGHNGSGKSSLLSLLAGAEQPDDGEIRMPRGLQVALVEQFVPAELIHLPLAEAVLENLPAETRQESGYRADELLTELGFSTSQLSLPLQALSGGQQNLALLARAIMLQPELLLMDEPGNHMDVMALEYLQTFLQSSRSLSFLMISHDRELLNNCCERTLFLRDQTLYAFDLPFDQAAQALAEFDLQAAHARQAEEKEIKRLQVSARRLAHWGRTYDNEDLARKAKTMQKRVERLQQKKTTVSKGTGLELQVQTDRLRAKSLLTVENLEITTPDGELKLLEIDFQHIRPGDRIALLGRNGVGKSSTISRLVNGVGQTHGQVRFNPNVSLGYYDQELTQFESNLGRMDWLRNHSNVSEERIKQVLLGNGISYADFNHPVAKLSGGECARLMFMQFQLNEPNFLVLDEPTNHIDIQGREQLEHQLIECGATLLITSHDRRFIERVANRWWWITNQQLIELSGLSEFYESVQHHIQLNNQPTSDSATTPPGADTDTLTLDETLARIDELETLLREDRARKAKFQKPERHKRWESEIADLWKHVE